MRTVTVSCPYLGRMEIDACEVVYEQNGDGTAIYEFGCVSCGRDHMRHATIADLNQFRISGSRVMQESNLRSRHDQLIDDSEVAAFVLELEFTDDIIRRLS